MNSCKIPNCPSTSGFKEPCPHRHDPENKECEREWDSLLGIYMYCSCKKKEAGVTQGTYMSHHHCWNQNQPPACGIPLEKHVQCCLCQLYPPKILEQRFWDKVKKGEPYECWEWQGSKTRGYGRFCIGKDTHAYAHRFSMFLVGKLKSPLRSDEFVCDHICRNRSCVNTEHLRIVTERENLTENSIGFCAVNASKTHCKNGHEFTENNTAIFDDGGTRNPYRVCKSCRKSNSPTKSPESDWKERFDALFPLDEYGDFAILDDTQIKAFIAQELLTAEQKGRESVVGKVEEWATKSKIQFAEITERADTAVQQAEDDEDAEEWEDMVVRNISKENCMDDLLALLSDIKKAMRKDK